MATLRLFIALLVGLFAAIVAGEAGASLILPATGVEASVDDLLDGAAEGASAPATGSEQESPFDLPGPQNSDDLPLPDVFMPGGPASGGDMGSSSSSSSSSSSVSSLALGGNVVLPEGAGLSGGVVRESRARLPQPPGNDLLRPPQSVC